jgi:hypothetical protein
MPDIGLTGGAALEERLRQIAGRADRNAEVRVGFLEGATYPDGTSVPMVAAIQEFGAPKAGIPARPFFRGMIAAKSSGWGDAVGKCLVAKDYNSSAALSLVGEGIKGQLQQAIVDFAGAPLAPATVAAKGFDKQLIDSGVMQHSVDYEVTEG